MQKIIMLIIIATGLQGSQENTFIFGNSRIILCNGGSALITTIAQQCGYVIVGTNEQRILADKTHSKKTVLIPTEKKSIGEIKSISSAFFRDNHIDDSEIPLTVNKVKNFKNIMLLALPTFVRVLQVEEPILFYRSKEGVDAKEMYCYMRNNDLDAEKFWGEKAIEFAKHDLKIAYNNVLEKLKDGERRKDKIIALTPLSADTGMPITIVAEVAIRTITTFLRGDSNVLGFYIYLIAKNEATFSAYKTQLEALIKG